MNNELTNDVAIEHESDGIFNSLKEYYGVSDAMKIRIDPKTSGKNVLGDPLDLSDCLRDRGNPLFKAVLQLKDIGLSDALVNTVRESMSVPVGLKNMGATCYVNSFIQSLYMNEDFSSWLLSIDPHRYGDKQLESFQLLIGQMKYGVSKVADPSQFIDSFKICHTLQEDCSEFSTLFLGWLERVVGEMKFFEGAFEVSLSCGSCGFVRKSIERFLELRINPPFTDRLETMIASAMATEEIIEGYKCRDGCGEVSTLLKCTKVVKLPKHLRVVINRYSYTVEEGRKKMSTKIGLPLGAVKLCSVNGVLQECRMVGYLEHLSSTATSGHYVAHLCGSTGNSHHVDIAADTPHWWTFDDITVKRMNIADTALDSEIVSNSVYMVLLEVRENRSADNAYPLPHAKTMAVVQRENEILLAKHKYNKCKQESFIEQVSARKGKVDAIRVYCEDLETSVEELHVIDKSFFLSWCRGDDIRSDGGSRSPLFEKCSHSDGRLPPLSVFTNRVKYVPKHVVSHDLLNLPYLSSLSEAMCGECATDLDLLINSGLMYYRYLELLRKVRFNFATMEWSLADTNNCGPGILRSINSVLQSVNSSADHCTGVWVRLDEVPKISGKSKSWFGSKMDLLKKVCSMESGITVVSEGGLVRAPPPVDICQGTKCIHGCLMPEVLDHDNSLFVLKPKMLVEELLRLSLVVFPALNSVLPQISVDSGMVEFECSSGSDNYGVCEDCSKSSSQEVSEIETVKLRIVSILDIANPVSKIVPGESYYIFPISWITKLCKGMETGFKAKLPDIEFSKLICSHGDLSVDVVSAMESDGKKEKRQTLFYLIPESSATYLISSEFRTRFCTALREGKSDLPSLQGIPIVQRDRVTYAVGSVPPVCAICTKVAGSLKLSIRVLAEGSNERVLVGSILHRPGRSKLIGVTQGVIDTTSLGIDIKTHLLDMGIMQHAPQSSSEEFYSIDKFKVYVSHPKMRGSLVEIEEGVSLGELLWNYEQQGNNGPSSLEDVGMGIDTIYVDFAVLAERPDSPPRSKSKVQKISHLQDDKDAGFRGSLFRQSDVNNS